MSRRKNYMMDEQLYVTKSGTVSVFYKKNISSNYWFYATKYSMAPTVLLLLTLNIEKVGVRK